MRTDKKIQLGLGLFVLVIFLITIICSSCSVQNDLMKHNPDDKKIAWSNSEYDYFFRDSKLDSIPNYGEMKFVGDFLIERREFIYCGGLYP